MVQDAYSLRCMPQVHGASRQAFAHAREVLEIEINSATDNPLVFPDDVISGGNFHGQPLALVMDYVAIALSELGIQYTAAALVSENKSFAHPASVDSIPTSANQEDHVSMGTISCRKARMILVNLRKILAIELLCAAQGLDLRTDASFDGKGAVSYKLKPSLAISAAHTAIRQRVPHLEEDRELHLDIHIAEELIESAELLTAVESVIGPLD
jgi:histidine ammonia-lyase